MINSIPQHSFLSSIAIIAVGIVNLTPPALAQAVGTPEVLARGCHFRSFTSIDFPGAVSTGAALRFLGIDARGDLVGTYQSVDSRTHGFLLHKGKYSSIDHPSSTQLTFANSINPEGDIVGAYSSPLLHAYMLSKRGFTSVEPTGAILSAALGINPAGDVVGFFNDVSTSIAAGTHGFLFTRGQFTTIDFPGAIYTWAGGINPEGDIVGRYQSADGTLHAFLLNEGSYSSIDFPNSIGTAAEGINSRGDIVGAYQSTNGRSHGFLLSGGELASIDFPGATDTYAFGINAEDNIVGAYMDTNGVFHGFLLSH